MSDKTKAKELAPSLLAIGTRPLGIIPQSFDDCYRLAQMLAQSTLVPKDYKDKAADCCVAIMQGLELGLSPIAALNSIAVINGRASLWGDGALAVVRASGLLESIEETQDATTEVATCTVKRKGESTSIVRTFSTQDAIRAGLAGKAGPWTQYPQRMKQMRARSWALRDGFADVLKGMHIAEEAQDIQPMRDVTPKQAALAIPDDIADEGTVAETVSEAEAPQDALIANPQKYLELFEEQLAGAGTEEVFDETVAAHQELVEAGRLRPEDVRSGEELVAKHGKRFA